MLVIGSKALEAHGLLEEGRKPKDLDVIMTYPEYQLWLAMNRRNVVAIHPIGQDKIVAKDRDGLHIEIELAWAGNTGQQLLQQLEGVVMANGYMGNGLTAHIAPAWVLLALKLSHRYLKNSPHFLKTMRDIQTLRRAGAEVPDWLKPWLKLREKETYAYKHPSLNRNKSEFFSGDGIVYTYDHDSIHRAMARGERPAYTYFQRDGSEVAVDRNKWETLPEEIKLNSVVEEATVLALERSQVPFRGKVEPHRSYTMALGKVCTSITSGWWREYAWEHYDAAAAAYDPNYVDWFWHCVDIGDVLPAENKAESMM